jgi:hypothetical protein
MLIGKDAEKICRKLGNAQNEGDWKKVGELWRKRGSIGRLHNIIRYIRMTPQRREEFDAIEAGGDLEEFDGLELIQNNQTRWNSYYVSITRALNLKERIELFCLRHKPGRDSKGVSEDILNDRHWKELQYLHTALEDFYEGTLMTEGRATLLSDHFQTLDWLLGEIECTKETFSQLYKEDNRAEDHWLTGAAEQSWLKCEKYYKMTDDSAAYYAALAMNPAIKWDWFLQKWSDDEIKAAWIPGVKEKIRELWKEEYKDKYSQKSAVLTNPPPPKKQLKAFTRVRDHKRLKTGHISDLQVEDAFDEYMGTNRLVKDEKFDPLPYWHARYEKNPDVARFALDMLAIPPMSDECERSFSSAKILLNDRRSRLLPDIIEANECLRAWFGKPKKNTFDDEIIGMNEGEDMAEAESEVIEDIAFI